MDNTNQKPSIFAFDLEQLRSYFVEHEFARYAADQVYNWLYRHLEFDPSKWTNIAQKIVTHIHEHMSLELPKIVWMKTAADGTHKFLVAFTDQQTVECVVIPAKDRLTLCLSSQVGCAIGCRFCHTATFGFKRNLQIWEIVGQLLVAAVWLKTNTNTETNTEAGASVARTRISNLVYMGQGEPLHNYENVQQATKIFMEPKGLGYGQRKITLSTSGLVPQIEKMVSFPPINLAISLHAATDEVRTRLMPINKTYDLRRLFAALKKFPLKAQRRITYEYLLIDGINNRIEDVVALEQLIVNKKESKLNLIPYNEFPGSEFRRPSEENIQWFQRQMDQRGFCCTVRLSKGDDILAACGQLKSTYTQAQMQQATVIAHASTLPSPIPYLNSQH